MKEIPLTRKKSFEDKKFIEDKDAPCKSPKSLSPSEIYLTKEAKGNIRAQEKNAEEKLANREGLSNNEAILIIRKRSQEILSALNEWSYESKTHLKSSFEESVEQDSVAAKPIESLSMADDTPVDMAKILVRADGNDIPTTGLSTITELSAIIAPSSSDRLISIFEGIREKYIFYPHPSNDLLEKYKKDSNLHWKCILSDVLERSPTDKELQAFLAKLDRKAQELVRGSYIWMRRRLQTLEKILESGRIKSQFEVNTSGGLLDREARTISEVGLFNYINDLDPKLRPRYGYLTKDRDGLLIGNRKLKRYGSVAIRFKDTIKHYTTVTMDDSLIHFDSQRDKLSIKPAPYTKPDRGIFPLKKICTTAYGEKTIEDSIKNPLTYTKLSQIRDYPEAQIHQDLTREHIAEVVFIIPDNSDTDKEMASIETKYKDMLNNIPYRFVAINE